MSKEPIYEIVRSFSKTVQVKQFQPESNFCSVKESFYEMPTEEEKLKKSKELYEFARLEVMKGFTKSEDKFFEDLKASVAKGYRPTVPEWERLTPEQQEYFQELKRSKARADYKDNKEKPNREKCGECNAYRYVGEECSSCSPSVVGDRENMKTYE